MRDDGRYATSVDQERAVNMPSTCDVNWLWVILSATGRSPEASIRLALDGSVGHLVVDPWYHR